ncbi:hypothetical protein BABINDRAFT_162352 [Babjeviella inositovora NRRL Y-12698]|uniref:Protein phosphatase PP2A regulatory subunit A n=1 Tax=Babjeviella inositovora NRRL Y-12698 TaxID=984486 RepID=A0A1E3QNT4_9ASCO|nr:uncharacterized protein BABINDRAFT_162352 [Babjeviella inositovora NRRL Y-12698]ODQ78647.1 hypothetical protein BABINDRAFT_162352 [Babjeviella inositovora NRRL Y-12698]
MSTPENELYPLALLMDELKHEDVANRVNAMSKIETIARALGAERTKTELLPFLTDVTQDDEDEVFSVLAEKLALFPKLLPSQADIPDLLPVCEILASMEEPIVRDNAIASLNTIAESMTDAQLTSSFVEMLDRLSNGDWFSNRVAACGLYKSVLLKLEPTEMRKNLLNLYLKLVQDEAPMVRRAAATNLPHLIDLLATTLNGTAQPDHVDWEILSAMFTSLTGDDQDSVKFLSIDVLIAILEFFTASHDASHGEELLGSAVKLIEDESWRVRYMAADRFEKIARNFDAAQVRALVPHFVALTKDNEAEVRKAVAKQLPGFALLLKDQALIISDLLPFVDELSDDPAEVVRSALASEIAGLAPILGKDATTTYLLPIYTQMLKDEFPEVRLNIISKLNIVNGVIGSTKLSNELLPSIKQLADDKQWRVRLAIIEYIPLLSEQLGVQFFDKELGLLCMSWLWDSVYSIREAAVNNLEKLSEIFGATWAKEEILSRILHADQHDATGADVPNMNNFVYRITALFALTKLIPNLTTEIVVEDILPFVNKLAKDQVPNIRFNVAKAYLVIAQMLTKTGAEVVQAQVLPNLAVLEADADVDVRFFANKSINEVKKLIAA